jgi:hypothetical protein
VPSRAHRRSAGWARALRGCDGADEGVADWDGPVRHLGRHDRLRDHLDLRPAHRRADRRRSHRRWHRRDGLRIRRPSYRRVRRAACQCWPDGHQWWDLRIVRRIRRDHLVGCRRGEACGLQHRAGAGWACRSPIEADRRAEAGPVVPTRWSAGGPEPRGAEAGGQRPPRRPRAEPVPPGPGPLVRPGQQVPARQGPGPLGGQEWVLRSGREQTWLRPGPPTARGPEGPVPGRRELVMRQEPGPPGPGPLGEPVPVRRCWPLVRSVWPKPASGSAPPGWSARRPDGW